MGDPICERDETETVSEVLFFFFIPIRVRTDFASVPSFFGPRLDERFAREAGG